MLKKILFIGGALILILSIWATIHAFQTNANSPSVQLFNTDFVTSLSRQVVSGLPGSQVKGKAEVSYDELGEISPVAGMVTIKKNVLTIRGGDVATEYITLHASKRNAQPINISNWSLQSMITDTWIGLPKGAQRYSMGIINELHDIYLAPGENAIIVTGESPVGVSFKVNVCSGYLSKMQTFTPRIQTSCELPQNVLTPTIDNIKTYGDSCLQLVANLSPCSYVTNTTAGFADTNASCRSFIQPRFTYTSCIAQRQTDSDFYSPKEWRIFLNQPHRVWKDSYEIIRLLDDKNRTVDVFNY